MSHRACRSESILARTQVEFSVAHVVRSDTHPLMPLVNETRRTRPTSAYHHSRPLKFDSAEHIALATWTLPVTTRPTLALYWKRSKLGLSLLGSRAA